MGMPQYQKFISCGLMTLSFYLTDCTYFGKSSYIKSNRIC